MPKDNEDMRRSMNLLGFEPTTVKLRGRYYPALRVGQSLFVNLRTGADDENVVAVLAASTLDTMAQCVADMLTVSGYELRHIDEFKE